MEALTKIGFEITEAIEGTALSEEGVQFAADGADERMFFLVNASAEDDTLTAVAGEGVFAGGDKKFTAPSGVSVLRIEVGAHRKAGAVTLKGAATTKVTAIVLA